MRVALVSILFLARAAYEKEKSTRRNTDRWRRPSLRHHQMYNNNNNKTSLRNNATLQSPQHRTALGRENTGLGAMVVFLSWEEKKQIFRQGAHLFCRTSGDHYCTYIRVRCIGTWSHPKLFTCKENVWSSSHKRRLSDTFLSVSSLRSLITFSTLSWLNVVENSSSANGWRFLSAFWSQARLKVLRWVWTTGVAAMVFAREINWVQEKRGGRCGDFFAIC